jgi:tetratricopeptide (TPR) repeat protein
MIMKKRIFAIFLIFLVSVCCFGQTNFSIGENLFMQNKPADAAAYLENSIIDDPFRIEAFLYLGIVYEQLNRTDEAIAVYRQVLGRAGNLTATVASNLGNAYFKKGSIAEAEMMYTQALDVDRVYAQAYLGRANTRMRRGSLQSAVSDYEQYLLLDPRSPQRQSIERLINHIKAELAAAARQRLVMEEAARAEAERRQRLLDEVLSSHGGTEEP